MQALGRVLQAIGWLWFAAGLGSSIFDLGAFSPLPGIILIFVARVIRAQAGREAPDEAARTGSQSEERPSGDRTLNTQRQQPRQKTPITPSPAIPAPPPPRQEASDKGLDSEDNEESLLEKMAAAGRQKFDDEPTTPVAGTMSDADSESRRPMSSDEMIARAHRRWDTGRRRY